MLHGILATVHSGCGNCRGLIPLSIFAPTVNSDFDLVSPLSVLAKIVWTGEFLLYVWWTKFLIWAWSIVLKKSKVCDKTCWWCGCFMESYWLVHTLTRMSLWRKSPFSSIRLHQGSSKCNAGVFPTEAAFHRHTRVLHLLVIIISQASLERIAKRLEQGVLPSGGARRRSETKDAFVWFLFVPFLYSYKFRKICCILFSQM